MTSIKDRPLAGAPCWIITLDRVGNLTQARGLADALGVAYDVHLIDPKGLFYLLAPFGPVAPSERFGKSGARFSAPWPAVAIGIGRSAVPYLRALKRAAGDRTFVIMMMDPRIAHSEFDLVWVPQHDRRSGPNIVSTATVAHSASPELLGRLRAELPADILALPGPRITVVLGGRNKVYDYPDDDHRRLEASLRSLADLGASFLITPSRRTHPELLAAAEQGTRGARRVIWGGTGENPYPQFLAAADMLVVTGDSANMTSEAAATGRPVYVFVPTGSGGKFNDLHDALWSSGAARPLPERVAALESWTYQPLFTGHVIAREVEQRWLSRRR